MSSTDTLQHIISLIDKAIDPEAPLTITEGNIIKTGYDSTIDNYRSKVAEENLWLQNYRTKLIETTGIAKLKVKHTGTLGYFLEIPKSQTEGVPEYFLHVQTLVNAKRYTTEALQKFEREVNEAHECMATREYEVFEELRSTLLEDFALIKQKTDEVAYSDMLASLATAAYKYNYTAPTLHEGYDLELKHARHPVIEQGVSDFVDNDLVMDKKFIHVITGPNMGGKSTFLRQNALIVIMAHIGSFVPAKQARIPLTDKVFSRVGASDNLFLGQSTFMVEMQEIANILHNATKKSFVIIDEVGRGTSTYDGMSLAWSILRDHHERIQAKTLFATHYHELIDESKTLAGVQNFSLAVGENDENLVFLRKVVPGGMKKSYGLEVARIAGIADSVIAEARSMLQKLENGHTLGFGGQLQLGAAPVEKLVYREKKSKLDKELASLDINTLTPLEALQKLAAWKNNNF